MPENIVQIVTEMNPQNKKWRSILFTITYSTTWLFVIGYFDFKVLTPLILPQDHCDYHSHEIPWWVELFYMTPASNGHPDGSFFHLFVLLILAILLGYLTSRTVISKLKNRN